MTISYSVTLWGVKEQLEEFFKDNGKITKKGKNFTYELTDNNNTYSLSNKELFLLAQLIHNSIFHLYPKLKDLMNYFKIINSILYENNLGLQWKAPNGLLINQKYVHFESFVISYSTYTRSKKVTLQKSTDKINKQKQMSGIMPNLVHSLDASSLSLLINYLIIQDKNIPFFCVHDCFASTANNLPLIKSFFQNSLRDIFSVNLISNIHSSFLQVLAPSTRDKHKKEIKAAEKILKTLVDDNAKLKIINDLKESFNVII